MSHRGFTRPLLALAVVAGSVAAPARAGHLSCFNERSIVENGRWARIDGPGYLDHEGPAEITAMAAAPYDRSLLWVTNGVAVRGTTNGGCSWGAVLGDDDTTDDPLEALEQSYRPATFTHLVAPDGAGHRLWVAGHDYLAGVHRPRVWFSDDARPGPEGAKREFTSLEDGLPAAGEPVAFVAGTGDRETARAHLLLRTPASGDLLLYTFSFGRWTPVVLPNGLPRVTGIASDNAGTLWAWGGSAYGESDDGGREFTIRQVDGTVRAIASVRYGSAGYATVFYDSPSGGAMVRVEGNRPSTPRPAPAGVVGAAGAALPGVAAAVTRNRLHGWDLRLRRWVDVTPRLEATASGLRHVMLTTDVVAGPVLYAATGRYVYRFDLYYGSLFVEDPRRKPLPPPEPGPGPRPRDRVTTTSLVPASVEVSLPPGRTADLDFTLAAQGAPTPLDVYFLVDTTTSMQAYIDGLRVGMRQVIQSLDKLGVDTWYGVGDVKDIGTTNGLTPSLPYAYRRWTPVTNQRAVVSQALDRLVGGGAGDRPEAQTVGLRHMLDGTARLPYVEAGQTANFRPEAIKVVILISDASFHQETARGYYTIEQVVGDLNKAGVRFVGIVADNPVRDDPGDRVADQQAVALGTRSVATDDGVDCDNDGVKELKDGAPLVCVVDQLGARNLAAPVLGLIRGIRDPGRLALELDGDTSVVASHRGPDSAVVDLRYPRRLTKRVTVRCQPAHAGRDVRFVVRGSVRESLAGTSRVLVHCLPATVAAAPPPRPIPPVVKVAPPGPQVAPVPPQPPQPIQQPPNANPNPNPNPQAGAAHEQEKEFQVATVGQDASEEEPGTRLAMSRRAEPAVAPMLLGAAAVSAAALATAMGRRTTVHPARARGAAAARRRRERAGRRTG